MADTFGRLFPVHKGQGSMELESLGDDKAGTTFSLPSGSHIIRDAIVPSLLCTKGLRKGPKACADTAQMPKNFS